MGEEEPNGSCVEEGLLGRVVMILLTPGRLLGPTLLRRTTPEVPLADGAAVVLPQTSSFLLPVATEGVILLSLLDGGSNAGGADVAETDDDEDDEAR